MGVKAENAEKMMDSGIEEIILKTRIKDSKKINYMRSHKHMYFNILAGKPITYIKYLIRESFKNTAETQVITQIYNELGDEPHKQTGYDDYKIDLLYEQEQFESSKYFELKINEAFGHLEKNPEIWARYAYKIYPYQMAATWVSAHREGFVHEVYKAICEELHVSYVDVRDTTVEYFNSHNLTICKPQLNVYLTISEMLSQIASYKYSCSYIKKRQLLGEDTLIDVRVFIGFLAKLCELYAVYNREELDRHRIELANNDELISAIICGDKRIKDIIDDACNDIVNTKANEYRERYQYLIYSDITDEELGMMPPVEVAGLNFDCKTTKEAYEKVTGESYDEFFKSGGRVG